MQTQTYHIEDPDAQYIKSVKVDAPSFDGRLDPQAYINWQLAINHYFYWCDMSESSKIQFAMMKPTGEARQYWENLERMMRYKMDDLVETWEGMKEKFRLKYVPRSFSQQLLDKWNKITQENKSLTDYIVKFDEYLNRCGAMEFESPNRPHLDLGQLLKATIAESS